MVRYEDACFNCGADCRMSCDLYNKQYILLFCDKCKSEVTELYEYDMHNKDYQLCPDCLLKMLNSSEGTCEECGDEGTLYEVDDRLLCENCALDEFTVLTEEDM